MTEKVTTKKQTIPKEYYLNRITKASGVPKTTVRKVINALPEVIIGVMADCQRVQICEGIILGGVMKDDSKRRYFNRLENKHLESKTFIRPTCEFGRKVRQNIEDCYNKKHNITSEQNKEEK